MKILRKLLTIIAILFIALFLVFLGYYFTSTKEVKLSPEKLVLSENNITVYDADGVQLHGVASSVIKQTTPLGEISPHLQKAFIDTEDRRFYQHGGYDFKRILRAVANNVKARSFKEGA